MDQQQQAAKNGSVWTKVILVVLAGLIGYFVGRGVAGGPQGETLGSASDTLLTDALGEEVESPFEPTAGPVTNSTEALSPRVGPVITTPPVSTSAANAVMAENQPAGSQASIQKISLAANGWVAIHEDRDGAPGNILGARRFPKGETLAGTVNLLRGMVAGQTYYAMLHADDGDEEFLFRAGDAPILDAAGKPVMATFTAR